MSLQIIPDEDLTIRLDFEKESARYEKNHEKFLSIAKIRSGKKTVTFEIEGEMCTSGITCTDFGTEKKKRLVYSTGVIVDEEETESFNKLYVLLEDLCPEGWTIVEPLKDDKFYVKIKADDSGKKFSCKSNLSITPKKFSEAADATNLLIKGTVGVYLNFEETKAGLTFTPIQLLFDHDEFVVAETPTVVEEDEASEESKPPKKRKLNTKTKSD